MLSKMFDCLYDKEIWLRIISRVNLTGWLQTKTKNDFTLFERLCQQKSRRNKVQWEKGERKMVSFRVQLPKPFDKIFWQRSEISSSYLEVKKRNSTIRNPVLNHTKIAFVWTWQTFQLLPLIRFFLIGYKVEGKN